MKTTATKLIVLIALFLGTMLTTYSCKKDKTDDPHGYMTMKMTDAPAAYSEVNVDVVGVSVHSETVGWIKLAAKPGIYNLLKLQNNVSVVLADETMLPVGEVSQIRLELGPNNTLVTTEGLTYSLKVPSGAESGLKINVHETIESNEHVLILLDFDAKASIVAVRADSFTLKPVITVKSVTQL